MTAGGAMEVEAACGAVRDLLGERGGAVLDEAGWPSWEQGLAPWRDAYAGAARTRLPGLAVLLAVRERLVEAGHLRPAAAITRGVVALLASRMGEAHPDVLGELAMLGVIADRAGRSERARELLTEAFDGLVAQGARARLPAIGLRLVEVLLRLGDVAEADAVVETAWSWARTGEAGAATLAGLAGVRADVARRAGREHDAVRALAEAWPLVPEGSVGRARVAYALGHALAQAERFAEAVAPLREAVAAIGMPGLADAAAEAAWTLVASLEALGPSEEALRTLEAALPLARRSEAGRPLLAARLALAARVMGGRGRGREAEQLLLEALEAERRLHAEDSVEVAVRLAALGRLCLRQGRTQEAMGWLEPAVSTLRRRLPALDERTRQAAEDLAAALVAEAQQAARAEPELAAAMVAEVLDRLAPHLPSTHPLLAEARRLAARR
jgi:tetratricopeptide (TPR) repeat protein